MLRLSRKARLAASHRLFTASSVQDMHQIHQQPQQLLRKLQSAANQTGVKRLTGRYLSTSSERQGVKLQQLWQIH